jgi:hypothetical protein
VGLDESSSSGNNNNNNNNQDLFTGICADPYHRNSVSGNNHDATSSFSAETKLAFFCGDVKVSATSLRINHRQHLQRSVRVAIEHCS